MSNSDYSFTREGRTLSQWLVDLVADDRSIRAAAAEAIGGMWGAKPTYSTSWNALALQAGERPDLVGQAARFVAEVRRVVKLLEFPRRIFVRRLLLFRMSLQRDWLSRVAKMTMNDAKYDALETRAIEQALTSDDPAEQAKATKRFARLFCASMSRDQRTRAQSETSQPSGFVSYLVLKALDVELLDAQDVLRDMLSDSAHRHEALEALDRMGAAALPFADDLFSLLDASDDEDGRFFNGVKILGVLAQTDKRIAQEVVARLNSGRPTIRHAAVSALDRSGDELALPLDPVVTSLRRLADDAETRLPALAALASVGRGRADVVEQVLAAARPRPPRWRHYPDHSEYRYDEVMFERGTAIRSARHLTAFAERVVPMLVDALDTFEEYDPDWDYHLGDHGRTLASLRAFGPAARTAVPGLLKHLRNPDGTLDLEVLNVLGEMGPAAAESLPALRRLHAEENPDTPVPENPEDLDKDGDRLSWAIWMIGDVGNAK